MIIMKHENMLNSEAMGASQEGILLVESFLNENYLFRLNVLNGKVEFVTKSTVDETVADSDARWRDLTDRALKSIIIRAKREDVCEGANPKSDIEDWLQSEEVRAYNPIREYLEHLPRWDGQNHVAQLFGRLPGLSSEQLGFLCVWMRSMVAHWLQMDTMHGNECVPTLIGSQGCGKTTFQRRLLPPHLQQYFLERLEMGNKFDRDMALTNNLLVNLDELDAIRPSQQASLKQTLSKHKVNGRPIFGRVQEDRLRYASFVASTNNRHPLSDKTGSRRYLCMTIPDGQLINNTGDINYEQLYAQVMYELRELKSPYWFNNAEVARIQALNAEYMEQKDIAEMVNVCLRKPVEGENVKSINTTQIILILQREYPSLQNTHSTKIQVGRAMKQMGYEQKEHSNVAYYKAVARNVA